MAPEGAKGCHMAPKGAELVPRGCQIVLAGCQRSAKGADRERCQTNMPLKKMLESYLRLRQSFTYLYTYICVTRNE